MFGESKNYLGTGVFIRIKHFKLVAAFGDLTATFESQRSEDEVNKLICIASMSEDQDHTLVATQPRRRCCLPTPFSYGQTISDG